MSIEAMKQALEVLGQINQLSIGENAIALPGEIDGAMDSLRAAIEQYDQTALEIAKRCGDWNGQTIEMNDVGLERFAKLIEQHLSFDSIHTCHAECQRPACVAVREAVATAIEPLQERITDLYRQLDEAEKQLDQQYKLGMEAERDQCVLILERLYERSGEQYKQYLHAARVLKGEI